MTELELEQQIEEQSNQGVSAILKEFISTQADEKVAKDREVTQLRWDKRRAERMRDRDPLTGLYNRGALLRVVAEKKARIKQEDTKNIPEDERREQKFSAIMIDLDKFKNINDTYGHNVGDLVLREVSKAIRSELRGTDIVARWGGEELVVVVEDNDGTVAPKIAEKLRKKIESLDIRTENGEKVPVTASLGVSPYLEGFEDEMISAADKGLYIAKGETASDTLKEVYIIDAPPSDDETSENKTRNQVWFFDKENGGYKRYSSTENE